MRPRPRDMECSISSLTRNQLTGVPGSAAPVVRGSSPSALTRCRRERGAQEQRRPRSTAQGEGKHAGPHPGNGGEGARAGG